MTPKPKRVRRLRTVFVAAMNYDYEGHGEPELAFATRALAEKHKDGCEVFALKIHYPGARKARKRKQT